MARRATAAALIAVLVLRLLHDVMVAELFEAAIVLGVMLFDERVDCVDDADSVGGCGG
jgi:hypothetical protein